MKWLTYNGHSNAVLQVAGAAGEVDGQILNLVELEASVRIESITYSFEGKLRGELYWLVGEEKVFILPLEGRGRLDFEAVQRLQAPAGATGIHLKTTHATEEDYLFFLCLDLTKQ